MSIQRPKDEQDVPAAAPTLKKKKSNKRKNKKKGKQVEPGPISLDDVEPVVSPQNLPIEMLRLMEAMAKAGSSQEMDEIGRVGLAQTQIPDDLQGRHVVDTALKQDSIIDVHEAEQDPAASTQPKQKLGKRSKKGRKLTIGYTLKRGD